MPELPPFLIIRGLTEEGQVFRPSDWIERLMDTLSHYGSDRRLNGRPYDGRERRSHQIEFLKPQMIDGSKCLVVDGRLRLTNPLAYEFLMEFVRSNRLCWTEYAVGEPARKP